MGKEIRLNELSKELNLSATTISRALSGNGRISVGLSLCCKGLGLRPRGGGLGLEIGLDHREGMRLVPASGDQPRTGCAASDPVQQDGGIKIFDFLKNTS